MTFLEQIFERLEQEATAPVLREVRKGNLVSVTGGEFLAMIRQARGFVCARGLKKGDRCTLLAPNSIRWAALDLALMAEGIIVVPLYARQSPAELVGMMKDSSPARICCSDAPLAAEIQKLWPSPPKISLLDAVFAGDEGLAETPYHHADSDALAIIYTSGTSGEPKGVVLNAGNLKFMIGCTNARLDQLMGLENAPSGQPDRIFHYLPFCFAASWILLMTALSRPSVLTLSTDLSKLSEEIQLAAPDYFINVPTLLERVRAKVVETIHKRGATAAALFARAERSYVARRANHQAGFLDSLCLRIANSFIFPAIRKSIGPNLKALICGSAPLAADTQIFFMMLGIPVLQVYGLTETTAICTLDDPRSFEPGRVGPAVPGIEMTVGSNEEILVRGPNIFPGYWQRPAETAKALEGGWFHSGDQGDVDSSGNWRITGRLKNLIILSSGHNIAPEPVEENLARKIPQAGQVVLVGNQRSFLAALVTAALQNGLTDARIQSAVDDVNAGLPHYKQIRAFHLVPEPFTIENGLLTVNGKLKRDAIAARYSAEIERLYRKSGS
jgi:long-chain acyl-CoA synthetase